jgi:hypothetical protein
MAERTGYSTDQFANFNDYENGFPQADGQDNPAFAYPGNRVPNIYDRAGEGTTDTRVQRGFIRGIFPEILNAQIATNTKLDKTKKSIYAAAAGPTGAVTRRCFFQFNPALILRSVEASTTVLNPLLQSATELLQPIPGQAAFEFQLLFNREREVSNHRMASGFNETTGDPTMSKVGTFSNNLSNYGAITNDPNTTNPYSREHVAELGVLADLYVLDSIIGQSITQDSISALTSYWDITQKNKTSTSSKVVNQDGTYTVTTTKPDGSVDVQQYKADGTPGTLVQTPADANVITDFTGKDTKDKLASVLGNSAFLSPLPIRIVFSSLFMVEGFVTSSNVAFHKFSSTMVPTVCSVTLNVQALYLGFAKKESYVSQQLATQFKANAAATQEQIDAQKTAKDGLREGLKIQLTSIVPSKVQNNDTLNSWWSKGVARKWEYPTGRDFGARFDSKAASGLQVYISENLKKLVDRNAVQNILIDKIELLFIQKDKLPDAYKKDVRKLQNYINEHNSVPGNSRSANYALKHRTEVNGVKDQITNDQPNGSTNSGQPLVSFIDSATIQNTTITKKYRTLWQSSALPITDPDGIGANPKHFGDTNIMVVMVVQMSCQYASGNQDTSIDRVTVTKSVIQDNINPNATKFIDDNLSNPNSQSGLFV